jgi:folate-binding protein YgfZ
VSVAPQGYDAALRDVAFLDRSGRMRLSIQGRAPEQVLVGLVSGKVPDALAPAGDGAWSGRAEGSALLTAKGRMVAVLRLLRAGPTPADGFLMDVPAAGRGAAWEHLRKFVPPRLATLRDESSDSGMLTVLGPRAVEWLAAQPSFPAAAALQALGDGDLVQRALEGGSVTVLRTTEVAATAFDVLAPAALVRNLIDGLVAAGASCLSTDAWHALRIEAGTPELGVDMDETTIPVEAGIHGRVVDYQKGCFTGQEVLIRIRDRGHVNRHLRGLRFGNGSAPAGGTELFAPRGEQTVGEASSAPRGEQTVGQVTSAPFPAPRGERAVGHVTSAAFSPRFGEVIGLGYVRREVSPPAELRLGGPDGPPVSLRALEVDWRPDAGSR